MCMLVQIPSEADQSDPTLLWAENTSRLKRDNSQMIRVIQLTPNAAHTDIRKLSYFDQ